ncbi:MAG TPA: helix-turn-helix domain-containing protein [Solirubrobacterales bacterium]|nr:helix-turn-helix domain-containing protein [Solirubrobacterales bacterium]
MKTPGEILREARHRHEVSQQELAARAGTTQSAISRIEQDRISPSVGTLAELLHLLGEELLLRTRDRDTGVDRTLTDASLLRTETERLDYGLGFANQVIEASPLPKRPGWKR